MLRIEEPDVRFDQRAWCPTKNGEGLLFAQGPAYGFDERLEKEIELMATFARVFPGAAHRELTSKEVD